MQKKTNKKNRQNVRLATHVIPIEYKLLLKPDLEAHTFEGSEEITLSLSKPTNQITLHSKELEITTVSIKEGKELTQVKNISYDTKAETATFTFSKNIKKGKATLSLSFAGILKDNMRGFYKSQYVLDGKTHTIATTQFEATDARRAFPCFDEPAQKAVFHVKLIVPNDKVAISNTLPNEIAEHESGFKIVSFDPTPKMSTYLLAFIVGDFEFLEGKTKDGVLVRIFTTPGKKHQGKFALDCAIKSLEFYNDYFAIPYPLNTLDMIAIPDFASGAMENWGAVTYRESALLVDEEHTALANRQWTAVVIAHELAHQWFGNLVTMEWWTHLWLNEGFASYIEYLAVDHMFPKWNIWSQFVSSDHAQALTLDSLLHTHPIEVPVHHPDEISEIFDSISYAKGASVIRMLAQYLGDTLFRDGLRHYLKKHSYKNASTIHLWEAFEKVSKKPVKKLMENWTNKAGYPVVGIEEKGDELVLSQKRYFASPISEKKSKDQTKWMIPFAFSGDREKETQILLSKKTTRLPKTKDLYIKGNPNETGVYRVAYGQSLLSRLHEPIKENRLSEIDRLGVIRDYASFAENGLVATTDVLELATFYTNETEYVSWMEVLGFLGRVKRIVFGTNAEKDFNQFALGIVTSASEEIGFDKKTGDDHSRILLRSSLIASAAVYGHKKIIAEAIKRFKNRNQEPLDADIRGAVYGIVARNGGAKEHAMLTDMYKKEPLDEERNRIGRALAQFTQKDLLQKTLAFAISPNVRIQNSPFLVGAVIVNPLGSKLGFSFLQKNWNLMVERYGKGGMMLTRVVSPLGVFTDKKDALAIKKFFKTHPAPGAARTIEQTLEEIYMHAAWKSRDLKKIEKWLKK